MKLGTSTRGTVLPALIAVMVVGGVSIAVAGQPYRSPTAVRPSPTAVHPSPAHDRDGSHGSTDTPDDPAPTSTGDTQGDPTSAGCATAIDGGQAALQSETGLAHAVDVLLANCRRDPQAIGLVNALQHLQDNLDPDAATTHGSSGEPHGNPGGSSSDQGNAGGQSDAGGRGQTQSSTSSGHDPSASPGSKGNGGSSAEHRASG